MENRDSQWVSALLGNGEETFGSKTDFGRGNGPFSVAIGDFNADGKLDLSVANVYSSTVSVLLGNGDGAFATKTDYQTGDRANAVAIGDLNADGKPDLFVANYYSGSVSVLLGFRDGTFAAKTDYETGINPAWLAVGDLNWDGAPDLCVPNWSSDTVSVLLNICERPIGAVADAEPGIARLLAPLPNPARSTTTIAFESPAAELVSLNILDTSGPVTRVLSSGAKYPAGRNSLIWDGRNEEGQRVASGVYFVRLRAGEQRNMRKILMLK